MTIGLRFLMEACFIFMVWFLFIRLREPKWEEYVDPYFTIDKYKVVYHMEDNFPRHELMAI